MSLDSERSDIETHFNTEWAGATPIGFDGHKFEIVAPCVRISIKSGLALQNSFGAPGTNLKRTAGVAFFEVFTDGGNGSAEALGLAETIIGIFTNKTLTNIKTTIPYVSANREEAPFYIVNVAVPYTRDSFTA